MTTWKWAGIAFTDLTYNRMGGPEAQMREALLRLPITPRQLNGGARFSIIEMLFRQSDTFLVVSEVVRPSRAPLDIDGVRDTLRRP